jgi:hypothetical protein
VFLLPKLSRNLGGVLIVFEFGTRSVHILAVVILIIRPFIGSSLILCPSLAVLVRFLVLGIVTLLGAGSR